MTIPAKSLANLVPGALQDLILRVISPIHGFSGPSENWAEVESLAKEGYGSHNIVNHYRSKLLSALVQTSESRTLSLTNQKLRVLLALLLTQDIQNKPLAKLVDFGGGFGADFFSLRQFLQHLENWTIVESEAVGGSLSQIRGLPTELSFATRISDCKPDVIYASGAIQYLPDGLRALDTFREVSEMVILDRLPVLDIPKSLVFLQKTSRLISDFSSRYPSWIFAKHEFDTLTFGKWNVELAWVGTEDSPFVLGKRRPYSGYLLRRL